MTAHWDTLEGRAKSIAIRCCDNSLRTEASGAVRRSLPQKLVAVGAVPVGDSMVPCIELESGLIYCPFRLPTVEEINESPS